MQAMVHERMIIEGHSFSTLVAIENTHFGAGLVYITTDACYCTLYAEPLDCIFSSKATADAR